MHDLEAKMRVLKFKEEDMPDCWSAVMDGIHFSVCLHPWKGIAIIYYYTTSRAACQDEVFIPKESSVQDIAKILIAIHDKLISKKVAQLPKSWLIFQAANACLTFRTK